MKKTYSLYEAKARLSAIVRHVREGHPVVVTLHGEPVVEMRPIAPRQDNLRSRLDMLAEAGVLVRPSRKGKLARVARRPGALKRFLDDRNE